MQTEQFNILRDVFFSIIKLGKINAQTKAKGAPKRPVYKINTFVCTQASTKPNLIECGLFVCVLYMWRISLLYKHNSNLTHDEFVPVARISIVRKLCLPHSCFFGQQQIFRAHSLFRPNKSIYKGLWKWAIVKHTHTNASRCFFERPAMFKKRNFYM